MTVAIAHHVTPRNDAVLAAAAREASVHRTRLVVVNVVTATDQDDEAALRQGISDIVERVLAAEGIEQLDYRIHLAVAASSGIDDVAAKILQATREVGAELLVVGARPRSRVGKAFLGSVTQEVVLNAELPVLVVKGR